VRLAAVIGVGGALAVAGACGGTTQTDAEVDDAGADRVVGTVGAGGEPAVVGRDQPARCALPQDAGPCSAAITRYWFNVDIGRCEAFTWGGCEGNENNYETRAECEDDCACWRLDNRPDGCPCNAWSECTAVCVDVPPSSLVALCRDRAQMRPRCGAEPESGPYCLLGVRADGSDLGVIDGANQLPPRADSPGCDAEAGRPSGCACSSYEQCEGGCYRFILPVGDDVAEHVCRAAETGTCTTDADGCWCVLGSEGSNRTQCMPG